VQSWGRPIGDIYQGQMSRRDISVTIDTVPPRINPVSRSVYLNQGGSALVIYRLSNDVKKHGVSVGEQDYPGYAPWEGKPDFGLCFFALAQDQKRNAPVKIWAEDEAGNRAKRGLSVRVRRKRFRKDRIRLSNRTVARLANKIPGPGQNVLPEDIKSFIWINEELRKENNHTIMQASEKTTPHQFWTGAFLRPRGKPMAGFGDRRTYVYKKKVVTKAIHLGIDLADVSQSKIKAGARGRVIFAKDTGIYGNCIIIDHGLGVASLYAHLSEMLINTGEVVERGQDIARSGASGLALGDHLHFSMLINGVFVNPTEWLDTHWIRDNVMLRYKNAGLKPPMDKEAPQAAAKK
jgi:murein DD-endopeptidase MepM/ murein hydrolase activator NlpD